MWCALMATVHILLSCNGGQPRTNNGEILDSGSDSERVPVAGELTPLGDTTLTESGLKVLLFSEAPLTSRHENLYLKVEHTDGTPVTGADITFLPLMDMGMMSHGAPHVQPVELTGGWYRGSATFIMKDMEYMGRGWLLNVALSVGSTVESLIFKLTVAQADVARTVAFDAGGEGRFFISLLMPDSVLIGRHTAAFMLHGVDHNAFPAADGYTIRLETSMSGMGHSSNENRDATDQGEGRYATEVDLDGAGPWEMRCKLFKDGKQVSTDPIVFKVDVID